VVRPGSTYSGKAMAVTVINTPGLLGPGDEIRLTWTGPTPVDDTIYAFTTNNSMVGSILTHGASSGVLMMGYLEDVDRLTGGSDAVADGAATTLSLSHFHHSGALVESGISAGWTFSKLGNYAQLLQRIYGKITSGFTGTLRNAP
jgi:hypothetical protein